jgi:hypothetical protein
MTIGEAVEDNIVSVDDKRAEASGIHDRSPLL